MNNTYEQQMAIDTDNSNIIVSAGAGSGKTAVLTQRVIRKIKDGISVDKLLVLTFTNEAANEMKSRIRKSIIKNKLFDQLNLLDSAYITTFDSFALSIVKKYHYLLNINKNVGITDSNIITIYKYKMLDSIFDSLYGDTYFDKLINDFCLKDDISIKNFIIKLSDQLDLLIDKETYLDNYLNNFYNDDNINNLINKYEDIIKNKIIDLRELYTEFISYIDDKLINKLDNYFKILFDGNNYDDFVLFNTLSSIRFTSVSEDGISLKEEIKLKIDEIKNLLRFSSIDDIKNGINQTKDYVIIIIDIIKKLNLLVNEYKDKNGLYEFNDIAHMAIKVVSDNIDARMEIRDYFNEIMIDEYQDTSIIQEEFISYIANNNVYMVGDIKQSIYRFRNANPDIFQNKYDKYALLDGGIKIDLLKNFRSRSETLFNINEIFNLIMDNDIGKADYIRTHNMIYGNKDYDLEDTKVNNYLEIYNYDGEDSEFTNYEKELFIISDDINNKIKNKYQVFDKDTKKLRNITYSDICIITDRNKYLDKYRKILEFNGIPSVVYMDNELTSDMVVMVLKNLFDLVNHVFLKIYDDKFRYLFISVARSFLFSYSDDCIYEINKNKKFYDDKIYKLCLEIDMSESLVLIINQILDKFLVYEKLTNLYDIDKDIVRISNLMDIANNLNKLGYDMTRFIQYLDTVNDMGLSVKYSSNNQAGNMVKIMNIHKSKGLEFSLCYFTGMDNKFTIKEISSNNLFSEKIGIILPYMNESVLTNTIMKDIYVNNYLLEEVSEKIRLFYVALTRCREKMIILASIPDDHDGYSHMVSYNKRIKYRSFLDILKSINVVDKYIVNKKYNIDRDYDKIKISNIMNSKCDIKIIDKEIKIDYNKLDSKHFSKKIVKLIDKDTINKINYGTKMHDMLEYALDDNEIMNKLLDNFDKNYINMYREYEFKYIDDNNIYSGVIDLMLEYDNYINIIDYKLKNIQDKEYVKQLNGYRKYIEKISNKNVNIYLYSLIDNELIMLE